MEVKIIDSEDGSNPVIVVKQDAGFGEQFIQLSQYQAAKLANELVEKVDELEEIR